MKHRNLLIAIAMIGLTGGTVALATGKTGQTKQHTKSEERSEKGERREQGEEDENNKAEQARLQHQAKITMDRAKEIALGRAAGNVEDGELEREHGKLVYSFDIRNARGTITEVQVDARNGKVVRVAEENAKQEAAEKRKDEREKSGSPRKP
ncbi:MAG: PepSY domain-containing protein [Pyrinomonadaceae bacterium]